MAYFLHSFAYVMNIRNECRRLQDEYRVTADGLTAAQRDLANYDLLKNGDFVHLWNESERALRELWRIREEMLAHAATHAQGTAFSHAEAS